jgi:hypothetical protein
MCQFVQNKEAGNNSYNRETILQTTVFAQLDLAAQYTGKIKFASSTCTSYSSFLIFQFISLFI